MKEKEIIEQLKINQNWYGKSYSGHFIGIYEQGLAIAHESTINPLALNYGLVFSNYKDKEHFDWFWDKNDMTEKREKILEKVRTEENFGAEVLKKAEENHKRFQDYSNQISELNLSSMENVELRDSFQELHNLLLNVSLWSYAVDAFLSDGEEDWLEIIISKELGDKATLKIVETLTLPTFNSFVNQAEFLFLNIVEKLKNGKEEEADSLAQEYRKKYFWIRSNYHQYKRVEKASILEEGENWLAKNPTKNIQDLIKEERERMQNNLNKKINLYNSASISPELQSVIRFTEIFTHLQDNRKERVLRMNTLFYEFIDETAKRFDIQQPLGFYMTAEEIFSLFDGAKVNQKEIKNRYDKGVLVIFANNKTKLINAVEYKKEEIDKNFFKTLSDIKEIKGTIAYSGKVTGIVRVLRNIQEINQFKEGEILVANQTTPEYVPAMKKAAAVITDQGGITSHAAIVAREFKLPAIIGTKIATQVLKDGDMVEVDAEKGVVKVIK